MLIPAAHAESPLMEPWDGPALVAFADGRVAGAAPTARTRPARYVRTTNNLLALASAGVSTPAADIVITDDSAPAR
jgi:glutamate synthase (NADPH/NADH) large chain